MCVQNIHTFSEAPWKINIVTYTRACLEFRNLKLGNGVSRSETGRKEVAVQQLGTSDCDSESFFFKKDFVALTPKAAQRRR